MDVLGARIRVRTECVARARFLRETLAPSMEKLRESGRVRYWEYQGAEINPEAPIAEYDVVALPGPQVGSELTVQLLEAFRSHHAFDLDEFHDSAMLKGDEASFLRRLGSADGLEAFRRFHHLDSMLAIERGETARDLKSALFYSFELMDLLGIPKHERALWISKWIKSLSARIGEASWLQHVSERAIALGEEHPELLEGVRSLARGEFESMPRQLDKDSGELLEIVRLFRKSEPSLPERRPLFLVVLHSYVHLALLRREIDTNIEAALLILAYSELRRDVDPEKG